MCWTMSPVERKVLHLPAFVEVPLAYLLPQPLLERPEPLIGTEDTVDVPVMGIGSEQLGQSLKDAGGGQSLDVLVHRWRPFSGYMNSRS